MTDAVPAVAIRAEGTLAVSWLALTKVVVRFVPFQVTTVDAVKPPPLAVRVKVGPPAVALVGEMLVRLSAGLMVKVSAGGEV